eukprot:PhF_6_TR15623/c0_g1_i1/m.24239
MLPSSKRKGITLSSSLLVKILVALLCFYVGWQFGGSYNNNSNSNGVAPKPSSSQRRTTADEMEFAKPQLAATVMFTAAPKQTPPPQEGGEEDNRSGGDEVVNTNNPNAKYAKMYNRPETLNCPPESDFKYLQIPLAHLPRKKPTSVREKYNRRAHNCGRNGIWNRVTRKDHEMILDVLFKMAKLKRGAYVFDWGTGCGEKLQFLTERFNISGFGIDVSDLTIHYAQANTSALNHYCVADGTKMEWIPSNYFDNAISFGSVYHVYNRTMFCHVLREMVRMIVPGGSIYNGWTENGEFKREHIEPCLGDLPVEIQIVEEREAFHHVPNFPLKAHQEVPNTYSLVVFKNKATTPKHFEKFPIQCDKHKCVKV